MPPFLMWQFLNFFPLPQGHGSLQPTFGGGCGSARSFDRHSPTSRSLSDSGGRSRSSRGPLREPLGLPSRSSLRKFWSSCSMRKIKSVTRSPMLVHMTSKVSYPRVLFDFRIDLPPGRRGRRPNASGPSPAGDPSTPYRGFPRTSIRSILRISGRKWSSTIIDIRFFTCSRSSSENSPGSGSITGRFHATKRRAE